MPELAIIRKYLETFFQKQCLFDIPLAVENIKDLQNRLREERLEGDGHFSKRVYEHAKKLYFEVVLELILCEVISLDEHVLQNQGRNIGIIIFHELFNN